MPNTDVGSVFAFIDFYVFIVEFHEKEIAQALILKS